MEDESTLDFNFWPSYADLMLSLVLILVLVLFLVTAIISEGTVNLSHIDKNQRDMIDKIAALYHGKRDVLADKSVVVYVSDPAKYDVRIINEPTLQQITFADRVLFISDDYRLKPEGQEVLRTVGKALKEQLAGIREIQVQGHADTDSSRRFRFNGGNTVLASMRAIEVLRFLQTDVGIDPAEKLMSATSFGEFKPVQRTSGSSYGADLLREHNSNVDLKNRNRRIELLLFYKL